MKKIKETLNYILDLVFQIFFPEKKGLAEVLKLKVNQRLCHIHGHIILWESISSVYTPFYFSDFVTDGALYMQIHLTP